ncbi:hypothetical protein EJB05_39329, partial [Eragrostis curvula]
MATGELLLLCGPGKASLMKFEERRCLSEDPLSGFSNKSPSFLCPPIAVHFALAICCSSSPATGYGEPASVRRSLLPSICNSIAYAEKELVAEKARQNVRWKEMEIRIRKQLQTVELPPSSYDTAWVSMVPVRDSDQTPNFPQCVEWILQNQQEDGSWGTNRFDPPVNKDVLLSTLACVLALKRWNVGRENIRKGLQFIGRNFCIAMNEQIVAPIGFNITFPGLLSLAVGMGLEIPMRQTDIEAILHLQKLEWKRQDADNTYGRKAYMAYVAEGLGDLLDWNEVMKFQRKNGSLFNSPSTTAAALIQGYSDQTLQYLTLLVNKSGGAVPAVYPLNIHIQLSMVDALEKMGISQYFSSEIKRILDMAYCCWLDKDEDLIMDIATCAMAFRLLRMNGYDVSSDDLSHVAEASTFHDSLQGYLDDTKTVLELYKASKVSLSENDVILDNIGYWSVNLLKDKMCFKAMDYALKFPFYATLERLEHKRNIEHFDTRGSLILKTEYSPYGASRDMHALAVEVFSFSQSIYQDELRHLDSWVKETRLDQLQFARQKMTYCYLSAAATIFPSELRDARILWAQNALLTAVVDDFFDGGGSKEELENLIALVEKWDEHHEDMFYSEQVKIVFYAIYTIANQFGAKASAVHGRDVTKHFVEIWLDVMRSMMIEAEWQKSQYVPTLEEYMKNAIVSFALGPIVLPTLYFVGEKVFKNVVEHKDDHYLSKELAKRSIQNSIDTSRRNLLRLVLRKENAVPRPCKELFWKMCKILHLFYFQTDGFSSPKEMVGAVNAVINEPLKLPNSS